MPFGISRVRSNLVNTALLSIQVTVMPSLYSIAAYSQSPIKLKVFPDFCFLARFSGLCLYSSRTGFFYAQSRAAHLPSRGINEAALLSDLSLFFFNCDAFDDITAVVGILHRVAAGQVVDHVHTLDYLSEDCVIAV